MSDQYRKLYAFLPAKPGVGASTVCLNTAGALAKLSSRVCLLDFDLQCGALDFLLNLQAGFSVRDVAEHAGQLNSSIWERHVTRAGNLEVLRAGRPQPDRPVSADRLRSVAQFASQSYNEVCVDLPAVGDPCALPVLEMATDIFLVTTAELPTLHLAQRTLDLLRERGLKNRVRIILNRVDAQTPMKRYQIEELLGTEVIVSIPNSWTTIQKSLSMGQAVIPNGVLGSRFTDFAFTLRHGVMQKKEEAGLSNYISKLFSPNRTRV